MHYIICILIIAVLQIIPGLFRYQDYVYDKDKTEYDLAKAEYDSVTVINRNNVLDSLTNAWISTNDTALRKIKKLKRHLNMVNWVIIKKRAEWNVKKIIVGS